MSIENLNYNNVLFSRSDGVIVSVKAIIKTPTDPNEDFIVLKVDGLNNSRARKLFYWLDQKRWTFNELNYFALNNNFCIKVMDKAQQTILASYGTCGAVNRVFNNIFGINFD